MPLSGDAKPRSKAQQLARGQRRYRRKVESAKGWQRIISAKLGPCRVCGSVENGRMESKIQMHHLVPRSRGGDDVEANIVPLCLACHEKVTRNDVLTLRILAGSLLPDEHAYVEKRVARGR